MALQEIEVDAAARTGEMKFVEAFEGQKAAAEGVITGDDESSDPLGGLSAAERALVEANVALVNIAGNNEQYIAKTPLPAEWIEGVAPGTIRYVYQWPEMLSPGRHVRFDDGSVVPLPATVVDAAGLASFPHPETGEPFVAAVSADTEGQTANVRTSMGATEAETGGTTKAARPASKKK
jgi:hypothetical protein